MAEQGEGSQTACGCACVCVCVRLSLSLSLSRALSLSPSLPLTLSLSFSCSRSLLCVQASKEFLACRSKDAISRVIKLPPDLSAADRSLISRSLLRVTRSLLMSRTEVRVEERGRESPPKLPTPNPRTPDPLGFSHVQTCDLQFVTGLYMRNWGPRVWGCRA